MIARSPAGVLHTFLKVVEMNLLVQDGCDDLGYIPVKRSGSNVKLVPPLPIGKRPCLADGDVAVSLRRVGQGDDRLLQHPIKIAFVQCAENLL